MAENREDTVPEGLHPRSETLTASELRKMRYRAFRLKRQYSLVQPNVHFQDEEMLAGDVPRLIRALEASEERERKWRRQLNHIEACVSDYADDVGTSHRVVRAIADILDVEWRRDD